LNSKTNLDAGVRRHDELSLRLKRETLRLQNCLVEKYRKFNWANIISP
jgi:hypothetical protein